MTKERKQGKVTSSLVMYMNEIRKLRMRRKLLHTTKYDWDRGRKDKSTPVA